jgi:hypothetical protein
MKITTFTSSLAFIQHQAKHTKKQQKPYFFLSLGRIKSLEDPTNPKNPILSKPTMCQMDLQFALHHKAQEEKKGCPFLPKGREKIPWSLFWVFF